MPKPKAPKKNADVNQAVLSAQPIAQPAAQLNAQPGAQQMSCAAAAAAPAKEAKPNPANGKPKPELVREPRANLIPMKRVPANLDDEIRQLAYLRSERRGFEPGHETEDWLAAEHEVRERYDQHSA
jgi:hypothetical protein